MSVIASGDINFSILNDACTAALSNPTCTIHADFDGSNPILDNARTTISVKRGDENLPFSVNIVSVEPSSVSAKIQMSSDNTSCSLWLESIPSDSLTGKVTLNIQAANGLLSTVLEWTYNVVRESSMLDWIQDWESNKTSIGSSYVITPKLWVGKKVEVTDEGGISTSQLTGVYIGPDGDFGESAGIYGYKVGKDIFHINEDGGLIGGWVIEEGGIQTTDGRMKILSEGSVIATDSDGATLWAIYKSGDAVFAKGNVTLNHDGSASFAGSITSSSGNIGGWAIGDTYLESDHVGLDSANRAICVMYSALSSNSHNYYDNVVNKGGVAMYYATSSNYGIRGYAPNASGSATLIMSLGSENFIAGWSFDDAALWIGSKANGLKSYSSDGITLGTNGLRGKKFYIDSTGEVSFADGMFTIDAHGNFQISGWAMHPNEFVSKYVALVSESTMAGLYLSKSDLSSAAITDIPGLIQDNGGIYLSATNTGCDLSAYETDGSQAFILSTSQTNKISSWFFDSEAMWLGSKENTSGSFASGNSITIGSNGIRGSHWQLNSDGSGAIAGDNITWDSEGNISLSDDVTIAFQGQSIIDSKIQFGNMLYNDPGFGNQGTAGNYTYNSSELYTEAIYAKFTLTNDIATSIKSNGIILMGSCKVKKIDVISSSGAVSTIWTGTHQLTSDPWYVKTSATGNISTSDTIYITYMGCDQSGELSFLYAQSSGLNIASTVRCPASSRWFSNNIVGSVVARGYVKDIDTGRRDHSIMQITDMGWMGKDDYRLGGFGWNYQSRSNAVFIARIIAKIPVGWLIQVADTDIGLRGKMEWFSSQKGTGDYETYICTITCGSTGAFDTIADFYLSPDPDYYTGYNAEDNYDRVIKCHGQNGHRDFSGDVVWLVSSATMYDCSVSSKVTTYIDSNGIYTGTLNADQIKAGTIDASQIDADIIISNGEAWALNKDGSGYLANKNIIWDASGNLTISGTLDGVTGSFKSLNCVNSSGNPVCEITFNSDGFITFSGDMSQQGYNSDKNRSLRFYTSDLWCRGQFGARSRNVLLVRGNWGYYYTKGVSKTGVIVNFSQKTADGGTRYYELPLYGSSGDASGFPVDIIVFNLDGSTTYNYALSMVDSQRALLINSNDDNNNVKIYSNGKLVTINGGVMREVCKMYVFQKPRQTNTVIGAGLFLGAEYNNNW